MAATLMNACQLPVGAREDFIFTSYRPIKACLYSCVVSAFRLHNETLNIWTHFLPVVYFAYVFLAEDGTHLGICDGGKGLECLSLQERLPFYGYVWGIIVLFCTSSFAHMFNCVSCYWRNVCFMFDYAAISLYGVVSAVAYHYYCRPMDATSSAFDNGGHGERLFLMSNVLAAVLATSASCWTRLGNARFCHVIRTGSFTLPFIIGSTPAFLRCWSIVVAWLRGSDTLATTQEGSFFLSYLYHVGFMSAAAIFNVTKIPERWWPGNFDLYGHSHQIFHVFIFLSIREQFWMVLCDMRTRLHGHPALVPLEAASVPRQFVAEDATINVLLTFTTFIVLLAVTLGWFCKELRIYLDSKDKPLKDNGGCDTTSATSSDRCPAK